jgi:hypothetical protein
MRPVVFLALLGGLTIYALDTLFDAPGWGFWPRSFLFILGMSSSDRAVSEEQPNGRPRATQIVGPERLVVMRRAPAALALAVVLLVGIGLGWLLRETAIAEVYASAFVKVQNQRLLATMPLKATLESVPSGGLPVSLRGGKRAQFRAAMTFENKSRDYCRQYEFVLATGERMAGVACRSPSGDWSVAPQSFRPPPAANATIPASAGRTAALDALIGSPYRRRRHPRRSGSCNHAQGLAEVSVSMAVRLVRHDAG